MLTKTVLNLVAEHANMIYS